MNKTQVKGRINQAVGKGKQLVGKLTGSTTTEAKGVAQKNVGKAEAVMGDAKEKAKKP